MYHLLREQLGAGTVISALVVVASCHAGIISWRLDVLEKGTPKDPKPLRFDGTIENSVNSLSNVCCCIRLRFRWNPTSHV
jgi:hypothetical protein